jgi:hypothetical protein
MIMFTNNYCTTVLQLISTVLIPCSRNSHVACQLRFAVSARPVVVPVEADPEVAYMDLGNGAIMLAPICLT